MRVLVTNDDGVGSPGLAALAGALLDEGHDVVVAAPLVDHSGAGASLVFDVARGVAVRRVPVASLPGVEVLGIEGSPALAVLLARLGAFGDQPRLVVSGINAGANTGRGILHSGTVGAALTAATLGMSGLAVSIARAEPTHWRTAARVATAALGWLAEARRRTVLNVNVPDVAPGELRGVRSGRIAAFGPTRLVVNQVSGDRIELVDTAGTLPLDPETDAGLVEAGFVCVTALTGLVAAPDGGAAAGIDAALAGGAGGAAGVAGAAGDEPRPTAGRVPGS